MSELSSLFICIVSAEKKLNIRLSLDTEISLALRGWAWVGATASGAKEQEVTIWATKLNV
jgi:hypothetical protein